jgi:CRP-like cAMP-binding protein
LVLVVPHTFQNNGSSKKYSVLAGGQREMVMEIKKQDQAPCPTCPVRDTSFCGALKSQRQPGAPPMQKETVGQVYDRAAAQDIICRRGEPTDNVFVLCHGWALRVVPLPDGRLQILSVLLPGDLFSITTLFAETLQFTVRALTDVIFSGYKRIDLKAQVVANPGILDALGKVSIDEHNAMDELVIDFGQRDSKERIACLLLRLAKRISARFIVHDYRYPFPLRQQHIANMVGLTTVHVNRVLVDLRKANIVEISKGFLTILDLDKLNRIARLN